MPTYEYACKDCGQTTEAVQAFTDDALTVCPHCGGRLRKVFGNVGISFKGSGFYKTDSRNSNGKPGSKDSGKEAASTGSDKESKSGDKSDSGDKAGAKSGDSGSSGGDSAKGSSGSGDAKKSSDSASGSSSKPPASSTKR